MGMLQFCPRNSSFSPVCTQVSFTSPRLLSLPISLLLRKSRDPNYVSETGVGVPHPVISPDGLTETMRELPLRQNNPEGHHGVSVVLEHLLGQVGQQPTTPPPGLHTSDARNNLLSPYLSEQHCALITGQAGSSVLARPLIS